MKTQVHLRGLSEVEDRKRVEKILISAAAEFGMADNTVTSRVPDTIRCYCERIGYGFAIGARVVGNTIIVDFNSGKESSARFEVLKQRVTLELREIFVERMRIPAESDYIVVRNTLPISDAAKEFNKKHFSIAKADGSQASTI